MNCNERVSDVCGNDSINIKYLVSRDMGKLKFKILDNLPFYLPRKNLIDIES